MAPDAIRRFDERAVGFAKRYGIPALRIALGVVFIWFGALKVLGLSPVSDLVADVMPLVPDTAAVVGIGVVEVAVGLGLLTRYAIRLTLALFFIQMLGTFLVLVTQPGLSFEGGNPLRLTILGEFVVKNLILFSAGFAVAGTIPRPGAAEKLSHMLTRRAPAESEIRAS